MRYGQRTGLVRSLFASVMVLALIGAGCGSSGESTNSQGEARQQEAREAQRRAERRELREFRRQEARERRQQAARRRAKRRAARERAHEEAREQREVEEQEEAAEAETSECDPNYAGACLDPYASDYDCEGGSGNGPNYTGPVEVVGNDHYGLDADGDGYGCE